MKTENKEIKKKTLLLGLLVLFASWFLFLLFFTYKDVYGEDLSGEDYEARRIMQKAWDSYRVLGKGEAEEFEIFTFESGLNYTLEQAKKNKGGFKVRYRNAVREIKYTESENKIRVSFLAPPELKDTVFIFIHNLIGESPDKIWGFIPDLRKVRRFAPLDGEFMGTTLDFEELTRRLNGENLNDFEISFLGEEKIDGKNCYKIALAPKKETDTAYRLREFWVAKDGLSAFLQVKYSYKEERGGYVKIQKNFGIIEFLPGVWRVSRLEMKEQGKRKNYTSIIVFNKREEEKLDENIFDSGTLSRAR